MRAIILSQVPDTDAAAAVTSNDLSLIGVNDYIVDRRAMGVASLNRAASRLPDLDRTILRTCDHPFSFAVKGDACDVTGMAFESEERVRVRGFYVVELYCVMACGSEETLVGGYAETIDLRVGVLNCSRADTREGFPEAVEVSSSSDRWRGMLPYCVVVTSCYQDAEVFVSMSHSVRHECWCWGRLQEGD